MCLFVDGIYLLKLIIQKETQRKIHGRRLKDNLEQHNSSSWLSMDNITEFCTKVVL